MKYYAIYKSALQSSKIENHPISSGEFAAIKAAPHSGMAWVRNTQLGYGDDEYFALVAVACKNGDNVVEYINCEYEKLTF